MIPLSSFVGGGIFLIFALMFNFASVKRCYFSSFGSHSFIFQNPVCMIILIFDCFNVLGNIDITLDKIGQQ